MPTNPSTQMLADAYNVMYVGNNLTLLYKARYRERTSSTFLPVKKMWHIFEHEKCQQGKKY